MNIILSVVFIIIWMYGVGPFLLVLNAIAHSDTNLLLGYAKKEKKSTFKFRVYQVLHCIGYLAWVVGLIAIYPLVSHFMK